MKCDRCNNEAEKTYDASGCTLNVCANCFCNLNSEDIYRELARTFIQLLKERNYERAYEILDQFLEDNIHYNYNDKLKIKVAHYKAEFLDLQGKYHEELSLLKQLHIDQLKNLDLYLLSQLIVSNILIKINQLEQAIPEIEKGLQNFQDNLDREPELYFGLLGKYAIIAKKLHQSIPQRFEMILEYYLNIFGISLPKDITTLEDRVFATRRLYEEAQDRYMQLMNKLDQHDLEKQDRENIIKEYISNEPLKYFKKMVTDKEGEKF